MSGRDCGMEMARAQVWRSGEVAEGARESVSLGQALEALQSAASLTPSSTIIRLLYDSSPPSSHPHTHLQHAWIRLLAA
jgi:hypothetical protein